MSSLLHLIQRSDWQFFVTCTYKNSRTMGPKARHAMQFELLRYMASFKESEKRRGDVLSDMLFVIREEFGEQTGRLHWHALVSGVKPSYVRHSTCWLSMGYWMGMGGGMTRIRTYNEEQDATSYITKGLEDLQVDTSRQGANRYEVGKFNEDDTLMLIPSQALLAEWKSKARESGRLSRLAQARRRTARCDQQTDLPSTDKVGVDNQEDEASGESFLIDPVTIPTRGRDTRRRLRSRADKAWVIAS